MKQLKYMPILRGRQEELKVLRTFEFEDTIYPCLEIIKEVDRLAPKPRQNSKKPAKPQKKFDEVYLPIINNIKAKKVFVDLPTHLKPLSTMKPETLNFLQSIILNRANRTEYINKLSPLNSKIIPVITTYSNISGEKGSIITQEKELRPNFNTIAFRTFLGTFFQDIKQIELIIKKGDYLIMDWGDLDLDLSDGDQADIVDYLSKIECTHITHRNPIKGEITNASLEHGEIVNGIDNSLMSNYRKYAGSCFSDYSGIKKDGIGGGGTISPGFIYYDAVNNEFYGYRYSNGGHKKGDDKPTLSEFETTIVPAVIKSAATTRMIADPLDYLSATNRGWNILQNIHKGTESGQNAAKFKRIGMEHYLSCLKAKISNGDFD